MNTSEISTKHDRRVILLAWASMLIASMLPDILFSSFGNRPDWLLFSKLILFGLLFVGSYFFQVIRPLRAFILAMLAYIGLSKLFAPLSFSIPAVQDIFGNSAFIRMMQPDQFGKLAVVALVLILMFLIGLKRKDLFLAVGNLRARISPVKWMGFPKADSWVSFGGQWSVYLAFGTGVILYLTSGTQISQLGGVLPFLPSILCMAALNAFNEEAIYRSVVLGTLEKSIGTQQVWLLSAAFFGLAHFWGVPSGFAGVLLSGFLGWILAKGMLETRGFLWPWWIHFLQDVVIFLFIAAGTVVPGG